MKCSRRSSIHLIERLRSLAAATTAMSSGVYAKLGPEAAADIGCRDTQPALVEIEQRGQRLEEIVRLLGGGPHRHHVIAPLRENAAAFDRMGGAAMLPELFVEDMRGLVEGRIGVAVDDLVGGGDIGVELAPDRG